MAVITFVLAIVYYGPQLGAFALRAFGLGGGTPISLVVRIVEPGSTESKPVQINGCLVLWIGPQLIVQRSANKVNASVSCHLNPQTPVIVKDSETGQDKTVTTFIETIARTDVSNVRMIR